MKKDKTMKKGRAMKKGTTTPTFIQSLLDELLLEILTKVASRSFRFLYSAKIVCKKFNQLAQHDRIFEHINNRRFERVNPLTSQNRDEEVYNFLEQCREFNNLEALYSQGMRWYFKYNNSEFGIESLKTAISKGHQASTYIYGAILVCQGDEKKKGLGFLHSFNRQKLVSVMECRERARRFFWSIRVDKEVKGRIIKLHEDSAAIKACSDCRSAQGSFTV